MLRKLLLWLANYLGTLRGDVDSLDQSLTQSYTTVTTSTAYGTMVNRFVKIGKLVVGQVTVTPNQTINTSVGEFSGATPYPPAVMTTCSIHFDTGSEQKTQYVLMRPNGTWAAYGAYTANYPCSGAYCYMTA